MAHGIHFTLKSSNELLLLSTYLISLCKYMYKTFSVNYKIYLRQVSELFICKSNTSLFMIQINSSSCNLYFWFHFFYRKLDNSLCTSLIIRIIVSQLLICTKCDMISDKARTSLCKQRDFLANGADLIYRRILD